MEYEKIMHLTQLHTLYSWKSYIMQTEGFNIFKLDEWIWEEEKTNFPAWFLLLCLAKTKEI